MGVRLTEHGVELLSVEVLHSPLSLHTVMVRVKVWLRVWVGVRLTEHGVELLSVEVLHPPLSLHTVCFGVRFKVEGRFRPKRIHDA